MKEKTQADRIKERQELAWKQKVEQLISRSRVPRHTRDLKLGDLKRVKGNDVAFNLLENFIYDKIKPPLILYYGVPGVGKTTLAYIIAWQYLESGSSVLYYQAEELLNYLQSVLESGRDFGLAWERLHEADLLILDDLGAHNRTPWREAQLDALVDYRYRNELPLVMTANKLDLSDRIIDRIKEGASEAITGESWRGKGKT